MSTDSWGHATKGRAVHANSANRLSTQYRKFPCLCNLERSPFSAWVHFAANGARREADRERLTERGHRLRGTMPRHSRAIVAQQPRHSAQESSDWAAGAAVWVAVFGFFVLRPLRSHGEKNGHVLRL